MGTPWWQHLSTSVWTVVPCHVWQPWVPHVGRMRLLELHGLTGAGVFVAAGATGCAICGEWVTTSCWPHHLGDKWMALLCNQNPSHFASVSRSLHLAGLRLQGEGIPMRALNSVTIYLSVQDSPVLGWHRSRASPMSSLLFEGPGCHMLWSWPPGPCPWAPSCLRGRPTGSRICRDQGI